MVDRRSPPRVRFLLHGAERSGPPLYLLRLFREWRQHPPGFETELLVARRGPLVDDFRSLVPTTVAGLERRSPERSLQRALGAVGLLHAGEALVDRVTRVRGRGLPADVTVVNGATQPTVDLLRALRPVGEVVLIAHELSTGWCSNIDEPSRRLLLERVERYLAVSAAVSDFLQEQLGVPGGRIDVCRPPVGTTSRSAGGDGWIDRWQPSGSDAYTASGPGDAVVVGGAGVHDWRKAPELWLQLAARVRARLGTDRVRFVWFGGHEAGTEPSWPVRHELYHLGLEDSVRFVGEVADLEDHLGTVDIFVSTAREDAYPLVCAEACATGVPVVTFDAGGAAELVAESGCGTVVAYPDLDAMTDAVVALAVDGSTRNEVGRAGRAFAADHLDPAVVAPVVGAWILAGARP